MHQRRLLVLVLLVVVTMLSAYCIFSSQFAYGPVILDIGQTHGVHVTDLPVVGLWLVAMLAGWALLAARDS